MQTDGSQNVYMRNRYYDPATGHFTQEDPIGLAGGMNLYGFAGGDPVNFSDPFGLCPPWPSCLARIGSASARFGRAIQGVASNYAQRFTNFYGGHFAAIRDRLSGGAADAIPTLVSGAMPKGQQMLQQAVGHLQRMPGNARVDAFRNFAQQIETATQGSWAAAEQQAVNATVFAGRAGEAIAFNAAGQAFRGNIGNAQQFTTTANGLVANFDRLTMIVP